MKTILIGDSTYQMSNKLAKTLIDVGSNSLVNNNAIIAIESNNIIQMRKDTFDNLVDLKKQIKEYQEEGFRVHYTIKKGEKAW